MNGLAIAIQVASVAMLLAPAALLGWFGRRRLKSRTGTVLGAALGLGLGWMAVQATFHENSQLRTPSLTLQVPPGFAHEWIVLIADAKATNEVWRARPNVAAIAERSPGIGVSVAPGLKRLQHIRWDGFGGAGHGAVDWVEQHHAIDLHAVFCQLLGDINDACCATAPASEHYRCVGGDDFGQLHELVAQARDHRQNALGAALAVQLD